MILIISYIFILAGIFFILSSIIGLLRFPDFYTKIHAAGVADSFGIPLVLIGLALKQSCLLNFLKILLIIALFYILNPISTHALIKAAWIKKLK